MATTVAQPSTSAPPSDRRRDVLAGLDPAWTRIDQVPFGATVAVDHVLLGPPGVVVITAMADTDELGTALVEARRRARSIMALLRPVRWVAATPVLIASGLADLEVARGAIERDGVLVVRELDALGWLGHVEWTPPWLDGGTIGAMVDVIVAHSARTDAIVSGYSR